MLFTVIMLIMILSLYFFDSGLIRQNIYIENIPVGGLSKEEALLIFKAFESPYNGALNIIAGKTKEIISFSELGLYRDYEKAVERAYSIGREKNPWQRVQSLLENRKFGNYILAEWTWNEQKVEQLVKEIAQKAYYAPCSAGFMFDDEGNILLKQSSCGMAVNVEYSLAHVDLQEISAGEWTLTCENIPPAISTEDAREWEIDGILASYTTEFDPEQKERSNNVCLAAQAIDNTLIMPGEEFSFNETTGPRTEAMGYQNAYVIINNKFEKGLGGGVCQVSSTLYNAVLLANLPVTERFPHSLKVNYVTEGMDSTVSYGTLDFKFVNSMDTPIIIHTECENGKLTITLFGHLLE